MEAIDVFSILASGITLGLIVGHWIGSAERKTAYALGYSAGISFLWPHLARAWLEQLSAAHRKSAADQATGGDAGARPPVL